MGIARTFDTVAGTAQKPAPEALPALLSLGRPLVMGILNVTPDSFSDGGRFLDPAKAVAQAGAMANDGADIIDVGAESTRPYGGTTPVSLDDEIARLAPVLPAVVALGRPVSIDTIKSNIAAWALDRGARIVNDVWGLQHDLEMAPLVAARGVPVIVMHNREGAGAAIDIIADVVDFFSHSLEIAAKAGIAREKIVLDPGIGFGKKTAHNLQLIARLDELRRLGRPVCLGVSRKGFLGKVLGRPQEEHLAGSLATVAYALAHHSAQIVRVHDVAETRDVVA
ncbi:MAG: dihydropteroate synthase, partial [Candidatus Binataceae bacterium]